MVACHFAFSKFGKPEVRDASWFAIHPSSAASWEGCRRIKVVPIAFLGGFSPGSFDRICSIASIMPRFASGRVTDEFHGPRVDGFDLIGLQSDTVTADRFRTKR